MRNMSHGVGETIAGKHQLIRDPFAEADFCTVVIERKEGTKWMQRDEYVIT